MKSNIITFPCTFALIMILVVPISAFANKQDEQRATAAFQKGIDLYKKGNMEGAVKEFRRADALKPSWRLQYNIGQCEAALRRYGLAIEAFEQYLGQGGDEVPKDRQDEVLKELDRMRRMVGTVVVKGQPGVDIYVDIIKHGNTANKPSFQITAGIEHEISFYKEGKKLGSVNLVVSGGQVLEVPVNAKGPADFSISTPDSSNSITQSPTPPTPPAILIPESEPQYENMRQIKTALRERRITKAQYQEFQKQIRANRQAEYDAIKADLKAGKITERDYNIKIAACRKKYEGD